MRKKFLAAVLAGVMTATLMPVTASARTTNYVDGVATLEKGKFTTANTVLVIDDDKGDLAKEGTAEFMLELDGAQWGYGDAWGYYYGPQAEMYAAIEVMVMEAEPAVVEFNIINPTKAYVIIVPKATDEFTRIPLFTRITAKEGDVTVTLNGGNSVVSDGTYKFAEAIIGKATAKIAGTVNIPANDPVSLKNITLYENVVGYFDRGRVILELNDGFKFTDAGSLINVAGSDIFEAPAIYDFDEKLLYVPVKEESVKATEVLLRNVKIAADGAKTGDTARITVRGGGIEKTAFDVGTVGYPGHGTGSWVFINSDSSIRAEVQASFAESGVTFSAEKADPSTASIGNAEINGELYNIYFEKGGNPISPEGKATVWISVPDGKNGHKQKVYSIDSMGNKTDMNAEIKSGFLVFETETLGYFSAEEPIITTYTNKILTIAKDSLTKQDSLLVIQDAKGTLAEAREAELTLDLSGARWYMEGYGNDADMYAAIKDAVFNAEIGVEEFNIVSQTRASVKIVANVSDEFTRIPLFTQITAQDGEVAVTVNGNNPAITNGTYIFAEAVIPQATASIAGTVKIPPDPWTIKNITVSENVSGALKSGEIMLRLNNGFKFAPSRGEIVYVHGSNILGGPQLADDRKVMYIPINGSSVEAVEFILKNIQVAADGANYGDVAKITVSGAGITETTFDVGTYTYYGVDIFIYGDNTEIPVFEKGKSYYRYDETTLPVQIAEIVPDSIRVARDITFTFPEGVNVVTGRDYDAEGVSNDGYWSGVYFFDRKDSDAWSNEALGSFEIKKNVVTFRNFCAYDRVKTTKMTFAFNLEISSDFSGDINVVVGGDAIETTKTLTVGRVGSGGGGQSEFTDQDSGIKADTPASNFDSNTIFVGKEVDPSTVNIGGAEIKGALYDLYFEKDGQRVQPDGEVTVSIPVPEGKDGDKCTVYYIDASGNKTDMNARHENGYMVFKTGHFSYYSVEEAETATMKGDINNDTKVNAQDKAILNRYLAGWEGYDAMILNWDAADIDNSGEVNGRDKAILNRYLAGWEGYDSYFAN